MYECMSVLVYEYVDMKITYLVMEFLRQAREKSGSEFTIRSRF